MGGKHADSVIMAFTLDQVERLTGLSRAQLIRWDRTDFFIPSMADEDRSAAHSRLYTFRDVKCLRVLAQLRQHVSLQHLRDVKEALRHLGDDLWSKTTLYLLNRKVVFENPETGALEEPVSKQAVFRLPLKVVTGGLEEDVAQLRQRDPNEVGRIERKRGHLGSQPIIAGTRVAVRSVQEFHEAGYSPDDIIREYPSLTHEDVQAAISYDKVA